MCLRILLILSVLGCAECLMCYQCADSSSNDDKNQCQTYIRTMRKYKRLFLENGNLDVNECLESPCHNGGYCVDAFGSYICYCESNWSGPRCEIDYNECSNLTICEHGETCFNTEGGFRCMCPPGWTDPTCYTISAATTGLVVGAVLLLLLLSVALYILYRKRAKQKPQADVELQTTCRTSKITHQKSANHDRDIEIPSGSATRAVGNIYVEPVEMETRVYEEIPSDADNGSNEERKAMNMMYDEAISLPLPKLGKKVHA